jgi:two-component system sensor histidine kinase QseC
MNAATQAPTRWFSLRQRLLILLLGGVTVGWLATLTLSYHDAHHEIDELFDAQMVQMAQTLLALASEMENETDDEDVARLEADGHKYQKNFVFQLWDNEGRLLLRSQSAQTTPLTATDGFSVSAGDGRWRFYSQWDKEQQLRVQVGENHEIREELAGNIATRLLIPALFGLPLLGIWVWFATRRGLASLDAVTAEVVSRAPERLEPLTPSEAPSEIRPLLDALNGLFARVERTLDNERNFTADAAHELRTPLAAISLQAQVALRARDNAERDHAVAQLAASARRASNLVDQLLTLARIDPAAGLPLRETPLMQLVTEICADHGPAALEKDITLELLAPTTVTVVANDAMLRILLRNLLDNAIRYTPPGGKVGVGVTAHADAVTLMVSDSGPGIPAEQRAQVLQRFHRLAGQETEGSGLGLSIVARIAELHGARLELADGIAYLGFPGLGVQLVLKTAG